MGHGLRAQSANLLTALRVVLTPAFVVVVLLADTAPRVGSLAALLFLAVAASDVWDGRLARRYGSESAAGRTFDHLADIGFILCALSAYVSRSVAPWWVPAAAGGSFVFYAVDSWSRSAAGAPGLVGSRVGHVAGILNYSFVGLLAFNNTAGVHLLPADILDKLFWLVPFYSGAAVLSRVMRRGPGRARVIQPGGVPRTLDRERGARFFRSRCR